MYTKKYNIHKVIKIRVFLGIPLSKKTRENVCKIANQIKTKGIKLTNPENLHWTVRFFGEVSDKELERIKNLMEKIKPEDLEIEIRGIGAFPSRDFIKVIWLGVGKGRGEFQEFLEETNKIFHGMGKNNKIKAHLTIGRAKKIKNKKEIIKNLEKIGDSKIAKMKIDKIILYESTLTNKGPVYKELKKIEW